MASKINTVLLCVVIALLIYVISHRPSQVGRFQWLDTPGKQLAFDTATGQRCWVWTETPVASNDPVRPCHEISKSN